MHVVHWCEVTLIVSVYIQRQLATSLCITYTHLQQKQFKLEGGGSVVVDYLFIIATIVYGWLVLQVTDL